MRRHRLSPAQVEEIVRLFHAGVRSDELGVIYGVTGRAIRYRLAARGLHYRRGPRPVQQDIDMRRGRIHLLRGRGLLVEQMARELRISVRGLRAWMLRHVPGLYAQMKAERRRRKR